MVSRAVLRAMTKAQKKKNDIPVRTGNCPPPPRKPAPFKRFECPQHYLSQGFNPLETQNFRSFEGLPGGNVFSSIYTDHNLRPVTVRGNDKTHPFFIAVEKYNKNADKGKRSPPYVMVPVGPLFDRLWNNGILRRDRLKRERQERAEQSKSKAHRKRKKSKANACRKRKK